MTDDENLQIVVVRKRQEKGINAEKTGLSLPYYLMRLVDEEAREKGLTRSAVISYLVLCGLKAHVGEFFPPGDNSIKANYLKRGRKWQ